MAFIANEEEQTDAAQSRYCQADVLHAKALRELRYQAVER